MHGTIRLERHELLVFVTVITHVIFSVFFKNVLVFISFVRHHLYFYVIFVLKINIVFVNDSQNISVYVIVTVTEISLVWTDRQTDGHRTTAKTPLTHSAAR